MEKLTLKESISSLISLKKDLDYSEYQAKVSLAKNKKSEFQKHKSHSMLLKRRIYRLNVFIKDKVLNSKIYEVSYSLIQNDVIQHNCKGRFSGLTKEDIHTYLELFAISQGFDKINILEIREIPTYICDKGLS